MKYRQNLERNRQVCSLFFSTLHNRASDFQDNIPFHNKRTIGSLRKRSSSRRRDKDKSTRKRDGIY